MIKENFFLVGEDVSIKLKASKFLWGYKLEYVDGSVMFLKMKGRKATLAAPGGNGELVFYRK